MTTPSQPPLQILLIDDDLLDRKVVRRALQSVGAPVTLVEAEDISSAEEILRVQRFDCVVLDYRLPEGPSTEFLPQLRELARGAAFIVLTGHGDEQIAVEMMKAGVGDYLSKEGLQPRKLWKSISYAIRLRRTEDESAQAESDKRRREAQLRRFVESAPTLLRADSLGGLAQCTADLIASLLESREVGVLFTHDQQTIWATPGAPDEANPVLAWARTLLPLREPAWLEADQVAIPLRSRDSEPHGLLAARLRPRDPAQLTAHETDVDLLRQVAVMVSLRHHNLELFEAAAQAVAGRDELMAVVTHDLRNPLNTVKLSSALLRRSARPDEAPILDRLDRSVDHMARLVEDLVDVVRLEGGQFGLQRRPELVTALLDAARQIVGPQAESARIDLLMPPVPSPCEVYADRHRILQVLVNLLGNALKFTAAGGQVEVSATDQVSEIRFAVRDTGCGIPEGSEERVFARFWKGDAHKRRGLGLGLYITKGFIESHGGRIWYESQLGAGTTFYFTLPKPPPAANTPGGMPVQP